MKTFGFRRKITEILAKKDYLQTHIYNLFFTTYYTIELLFLMKTL